VHSNDPETVSATYFNSKHFDCSEDMKDIIRESIFGNTDVRIEINDKEFKYVPMGSAIEVSMIQFLMDNEEDVQ
jgi:hypothetical protein